VSEKRVLGGTFGPSRDEVAGVWRKLHDEKLHTLQSSRNITGVTIWADNVECMAEMGNELTVLVGKHLRNLGTGRK
jgi:hypothetical protein